MAYTGLVKFVGCKGDTDADKLMIIFMAHKRSMADTKILNYFNDILKIIN